jgi:hypothetical protein
MNKYIKIAGLLLIIVMMLFNANVYAQIPAASNPVCVYCGTPLPNGVHSASCPYAVKASKPGLALPMPSLDIKGMIVGAVFQNLLNSVFSSSPSAPKGPTPAQQAAMAAQQAAAQQAAEAQRLKQEQEQAEYDKMMQSYKLLDDSKEIQAKPLESGIGLDFKTLDGDAENQTTEARKQFENLKIPIVTPPPTAPIGGATQFFGDTMPEADLQTLVDPESNPNVVDLRDAKKFVTEKKEKDHSQIVTLLNTILNQDQGGPIIIKQSCTDLGVKLKNYTNQREQFQKTIALAESELEVWETANRNAMMDQVKDGLEYFVGQYLEALTNRGKAAERLQGIFDKNVAQMSGDGIDVATLQTKIQHLKDISTAGKIAELTTNMNDWQTFMKDGMSSFVKSLTASNNEMKDVMDDPMMQTYFETEKPELNAMLDLTKIVASAGIFGKWVARKMPIVATLDISIKTIYNGTAWLSSFNRISKAKKILGGVLETAKFIQNNIDNTYAALSDCSK